MLNKKYNFTIKSEGEMKVPVKFFFPHKSINLNANTITCLKRMAMTSGIYKHIAVLPDIHYKYSRPIPTGIVVATKNVIIPKFVFSSCGMSFIRTNLKSNNLDDKLLDNFFFKIKEKIPVLKRKDFINEKDFRKIISEGILWSEKKFGVKEAGNIEHNGNMFNDSKINSSELMRLIPNLTKKLGLVGIGVHGGGNHFIEMQRVQKIVDKKIAEEFGIKRNQIIIMLHSGSEVFGKSMHEHYTGKSEKSFYREIYQRLYYLDIIKNKTFKDFIKTINKNINIIYRYFEWKSTSKRIVKRKFKTISADSAEGKKFVKSKYLEANYAYVNRAVLRNFILESLEEVFGKIKTNLLWDNDHESFQRETIERNQLWLHRHGASRALSREYFKTHNIFKKTGQPIFVPGSMGAPTYLCAVKGGCRDTFFSANHGAGRILDRPEAQMKFNEKSIINEMKRKKIRLYRYGLGNLVEEAPSTYKNVDSVIKIMSANDIAQPVAKLMPIATLKGN